MLGRGNPAAIRDAAGRVVAVRVGDEVRLVWGRPAAACLAVASSRLPCSLDHWDAARRLAPWLREAHAWLWLARSWKSPLLVMDGSTGAAMLRDVAQHLGLPVVRGKVAGGWKAWRRCVRAVARDDDAGSHQLLVSPPLTTIGGAERTRGTTAAASLPARDQVLWRLAEHLVLLHARCGGGWSRLLQKRLGEPTQPGPWRLSLGHCCEGGCRRTLSAVVAAGGKMHQHRRASFAGPRGVGRRREGKDRGKDRARRCRGRRTLRRERLVDIRPLWEREPALIHWTRACDGPWPDETPAARHVRLLLGAEEDRSAGGALSRIIRQGRLHAGASRIRSGDAVVCFTALSPRQVKPTYRRHLRRWDASGYGLAISRRWLARRGARPVIYGDDRVWESLPPELKPFFQAEGREKQWRDEQEWRLLGDLRLSEIPHDSIELIVPAIDATAANRWDDAPWIVRQL